MEFSIIDFINQVKQLEKFLEMEFKELSVELRNNSVPSANQKNQFRLVEHLQYHDIMRQKLEHIRLFVEGAAAEAGKGPTVNALTTELIELSLALLRYTLMEYQEINVKSKLLLLSSGNAGFASGECSLFIKETDSLIQMLEELYLEVEEEDGPLAMSEKNERFRKIWASFSMESEREVFAMLFPEENDRNAERDGNESAEGQVELF